MSQTITFLDILQLFQSLLNLNFLKYLIYRYVIGIIRPMRSPNTLNSIDNNQNIVWDKGANSLITQTRSYYIASRVFRNAQEWQQGQYWHQRLY